ncbi:MAG: DUF4082 domain-containing protein [Terriglobia bacterium]
MILSSLVAPATTWSSSLWSSSTVPATAAFPDKGAYEIGVKFYSVVPGVITAIRFYKGAGNNGTHIAHLWNAQGALVSKATFTNETATGWQQVSLPTPVPISAGQLYIASYWDPDGHYALDRPYFNTEYRSPPLYAPASGAYGPNAVFHSKSSGFPTQTYDSSNYWVDVVFTPETASTPALTGASPPTIRLSPANVSFGDVTVGNTSILPLVVTNTGSSSVTVSQASLGGASEFSLSGPALPLTLAAGQNTSFSVKFAPTAGGGVNGYVSVMSNATDSHDAVSLSATGVAGAQSVTLNWVASSSSSIVGYNVFRGALSGGPYAQLNSSLVTATTYTDSTVGAGQTYYYVTTAESAGGSQSADSNQAFAVIP